MADAQVVAQGNGVSTREAVLAEMAKAPASEPVAEETSQSAAESSESAPSSTDEEARTAAPVEETDEEVEAEKVGAEVEEDPETTKRLATVQKQEKRLREQIAKERADAAAEIKEAQRRVEAEWGPKVQAAKEFEALKARARRDPAAVLQALGLTEDDLEPAAQQLYALSKAGAADPKRRVHAEQLLKEREREEKLSATEKRIAELEQKLTAKEQATQVETAKGEMFSLSVKAATAETPLFKAMSEKSPHKAREAVWAIATALYEETGEAPDASDVVAAWEKQRRAELDELGIDYTAPLAAKKGDEKRPGKTLGAPTGATTTKSTAKDPKEERDEVLRELSKLSPSND